MLSFILFILGRETTGWEQTLPSSYDCFTSLALKHPVTSLGRMPGKDAPFLLRSSKLTFPSHCFASNIAEWVAISGVPQSTLVERFKLNWNPERMQARKRDIFEILTNVFFPHASKLKANNSFPYSYYSRYILPTGESVLSRRMCFGQWGNQQAWFQQ